MQEIEETGLVTCRRRVITFEAEIAGFVVAKLVIRNEFGVDTEKVDVQFIYCCQENVDILAKITILIVISLVDAGFRALAKFIFPPAVVSLPNRVVNLTNSETFPLLAGTLKVHAPLQIDVTLVVIKFDWLQAPHGCICTWRTELASIGTSGVYERAYVILSPTMAEFDVTVHGIMAFAVLRRTQFEQEFAVPVTVLQQQNMMVVEPEYLAVDVLNCSLILVIAVAICNCVNTISLVDTLTEQTAPSTATSLSQNPQPVTAVIVYCVGKQTRISKLSVKEGFALKVNVYREEVDFAQFGVTEQEDRVKDWVFMWTRMASIMSNIRIFMFI